CTYHLREVHSKIALCARLRRVAERRATTKVYNCLYQRFRALLTLSLKPSPGVRERVWVRVLQRNSDLPHHLIDTGQHSIVPEPDDFVPARGEVLGPPRVVFRLFGVLSSIELDHKVTFHATKS